MCLGLGARHQAVLEGQRRRSRTRREDHCLLRHLPRQSALRRLRLKTRPLLRHLRRRTQSFRTRRRRRRQWRTSRRWGKWKRVRRPEERTAVGRKSARRRRGRSRVPLKWKLRSTVHAVLSRDSRKFLVGDDDGCIRGRSRGQILGEPSRTDRPAHHDEDPQPYPLDPDSQPDQHKDEARRYRPALPYGGRVPNPDRCTSHPYWQSPPSARPRSLQPTHSRQLTLSASLLLPRPRPLSRPRWVARTTRSSRPR